MTKLFYIVAFTLQSFVLNSQMFDSIRNSLTYPPKIYINYDHRNSFITNQIAKIQSVKIGVTYHNQFTLAFGYNWLNTNFETNLSNGETAKLKMRFLTPFTEYSFVEKNNWQVTIPVHLGFGWSFYKTHDDRVFKRNFILLYEPSMTATYRFFKYFGIGAGLGYRVMLIGNKQINENFNSPIYVLKTKIFFSDLYNDIFKKKKD